MEELKPTEAEFTVKINRFNRDGVEHATISLYENGELRHSYCDVEEIINHAFYGAHSDVERRISYAGLPSPVSKTYRPPVKEEPLGL